MNLSKRQLDSLGSLFGGIAGICGVLLSNGVGDPKWVGTIGGIATVLLGLIVQAPATARPTTLDVERFR